MLYQNIDEPAPDINTMIEYLFSLESKEIQNKYIYRGQLKEWSYPLIPSLYRRSVQINRTYSSSSQEYQLSLRKCGNSFIEMQPDSYISKIILDDGKKYGLSNEEYSAIYLLSYDLEFSKLISTIGYESALSKKIKPDHFPYVRERLFLWEKIIDELHSSHIRNNGFLQPYGYCLGMTIAQQYGIASELIDFTSDILVAAFFATHPGPKYKNEKCSHLKEKYGAEIGVIYRLPSMEGNIKYNRIDSYNYYTCPPQLHLKDICIRFEDKSSPEMSEQIIEKYGPEVFYPLLNGGSVIPFSFDLFPIEEEIKTKNIPLIDLFDKYLELYFTHSTRYFRLLDMPNASYKNSRLGRQSSVTIIPDELRKTNYEPNNDYEYATFQAIEDISTRSGFDKFYFKHTDIQPDLGLLDREYLWPENDLYKLLASRVCDPSTPYYYFMNEPIPKRIDLISKGYIE
jgi:hypothetical protein